MANKKAYSFTVLESSFPTIKQWSSCKNAFTVFICVSISCSAFYHWQIPHQGTQLLNLLQCIATDMLCELAWFLRNIKPLMVDLPAFNSDTTSVDSTVTIYSYGLWRWIVTAHTFGDQLSLYEQLWLNISYATSQSVNPFSPKCATFLLNFAQP